MAQYWTEELDHATTVSQIDTLVMLSENKTKLIRVLNRNTRCNAHLGNMA